MSPEPSFTVNPATTPTSTEDALSDYLRASDRKVHSSATSRHRRARGPHHRHGAGQVLAWEDVPEATGGGSKVAGADSG